MIDNIESERLEHWLLRRCIKSQPTMKDDGAVLRATMGWVLLTAALCAFSCALADDNETDNTNMPHLFIGDRALSQGDLNKAESEYRMILEKLPDDPQALVGLSRVYLRKARRDGKYPPGFKELSDKLQRLVGNYHPSLDADARGSSLTAADRLRGRIEPVKRQEPLLFKRDAPLFEGQMSPLARTRLQVI